MHAFLVCGQDQDRVGEQVENLLRSRLGKIEPKNRLDLNPAAKAVSKVPTLTIEDVRFIANWLSQKTTDKRAVIIRQAQALTIPAQHALLKTLEEPEGNREYGVKSKEYGVRNKNQEARINDGNGSVTIILAADSETSLLPTIRSRCKIIRLSTETSAIHVDSTSYSVGILQRLTEIGNKSSSEKLTILYEMLSEFTGKKFSPNQQGSIPRPDALKFMEYIIDGLYQRINPLTHQSVNPLALSPYPLTLILQATCLSHRRLKSNLNVQLALQQFILDIPKM